MRSRRELDVGQATDERRPVLRELQEVAREQPGRGLFDRRTLGDAVVPGDEDAHDVAAAVRHGRHVAADTHASVPGRERDTDHGDGHGISNPARIVAAVRLEEVEVHAAGHHGSVERGAERVGVRRVQRERVAVVVEAVVRVLEHAGVDVVPTQPRRVVAVHRPVPAVSVVVDVDDGTSVTGMARVARQDNGLGPTARYSAGLTRRGRRTGIRVGISVAVRIGVSVAVRVGISVGVRRGSTPATAGGGRDDTVTPLDVVVLGALGPPTSQHEYKHFISLTTMAAAEKSTHTQAVTIH